MANTLGLPELTVSQIESCPDRASFLQLVMPYYSAACQKYGIHYPGVCALQCIYETGVPKDIAHSLRADNNMGGLKGTNHVNCTGPGTVSSEGDRYAHFASVDGYIEAAIENIVKSGYYSKALGATNYKDFALFLIRVWVGGSDSSGDAYAWDVISDYEKYGLSSYENNSSGSVTGASGGTSSEGFLSGSTEGTIAGKTFTTGPVEQETARVEEGGNPELKTFYRVNMTGAQFIKQVLAPYCRSAKTGQGAYRLWFSDEASPDGSSGAKLYFKPDQYTDFKNRVSDNILEGIDKEYQFSFGTGIDSSVLDFSPDYTGLVVSLTGGHEVDAVTLDALTNEVLYVEYGKNSDEKRPSTGDSSYDGLQGVYRIGDSSNTMETLQDKAANLWYNMASYGYRADMTIIGDPLIEPQTLCSITLMTPVGLPHHSSGIYLIYQAVDSIEGGTFTTEMSLVRNAMKISPDESGGVDITIDQYTDFVGEAANLAGANPPSSATGSGATSGNNLNIVAANETIQKAVDWAVSIANDDSHGYDFGARGPVDYDCSGLVTSAWKNAGVDFGTPGTKDMRRLMLPKGFVEHNDLCGSSSGLQPGDVLINEGVHTAMSLGGDKIVHAAGSENRGSGNWMHGQPGDQLGGKEILVTNWYDNNWNVVLRYGS